MDKIYEYGFLRETEEDAVKAGESDYPGLYRTGLDTYLKVIFPNVNDWVHDKTTGIQGLGNRRPDYRSETLKLIVEFDGTPHYKSTKQILKDEENTKLYEQAGYKVIRIPWFIQLTNEAVYKLFGVDIKDQLFPSFIGCASFSEDENPNDMCLDGIIRAVDDFAKFPEQLNDNIIFLEMLSLPTYATDLFINLCKTRSFIFETRKVSVLGFKNYNIKCNCVVRAIHKLCNKPLEEIKKDLDSLANLLTKGKYLKNLKTQDSEIAENYTLTVIKYYMLNVLGYKYVDASHITYFNLNLDEYDMEDNVYNIASDKALLLMEKHAAAYIKGYVYDYIPDKEVKDILNNSPLLDIRGMFIPCDNRDDYMQESFLEDHAIKIV